MDIATRYQPRVRAQSYLDHQRAHDDSGAENEARARRKFQRTAAGHDAATFKKPSLPASAMRAEPRAGMVGRRRSTIRENRVPSGPRAMGEYPPGRRYLPQGLMDTHTPAAGTQTHGRIASEMLVQKEPRPRSFLPSSVSTPLFPAAAAAAAANSFADMPDRFSFGHPSSSLTTDNSAASSNPPSASAEAQSSFDFLSPVNFDDFQTTIASYEPKPEPSPVLDHFVAPGSRRPGVKEQSAAGAETMAKSNGFAVPPSPPSQGQSPRQRLSTAPRPPTEPRLALAAMTMTATSKDTAPPGTLSIRTRRQSTAPTAVPTTGVPPVEKRTPRKSVGPGLISSMMDARRVGTAPQATAQPERPSLARTSSLRTSARRITINPAGAGEVINPPRLSTINPRANQAKSMLPPSRDTRTDSNTPTLANLSARPMSKARATTPNSSGNKRQSIASGRMSGLGARTISPTDARRLKRLSMMHAPPMPQRPHSRSPPTPRPEPEIPQQSRITQPSPSMIPRITSLTPSSARASPDATTLRHLHGNNNNNNNGGVSLSTSSSYQSLHGSLAGKMSNASSRLPTPKMRNNVHSSAERYDDELVPPVPAIPKAFESPKEGMDLPFFHAAVRDQRDRKRSADSQEMPLFRPAMPAQPHGRKSVDSKDRSTLAHALAGLDPDPSTLPPPASTEELQGPIHTPRKSLNANHRRGLTVGTDANILPPRRPEPHPAGRKHSVTLQRLRLPPLNLLPLSTPTSERIAAFLPTSREAEQREHATPVRVAKTPSTPMTASRATLFRRAGELRSGSSHFALDGVVLNDHETWAGADGEDAAGVPIRNAAKRGAITPFASGSLPKGSGEYARLRDRRSGGFDDEYDLGRQFVDVQMSKPLGPRPRTASKTLLKVFSGDSEGNSIEESGGEKREPGGLRRKLSLGWRGSSSKAACPTDDAAAPSVPKHSDMGPPMLPASATWSGETGDIAAAAAAPPRPSLDSARRQSGVSTLVDGDKAARHTALHSEQPQPVPAAAAAQRATSWSAFNTMGRSLASKASASAVKPSSRSSATDTAIPPSLTHSDDVAADDEMRRLSTKRRDVDTAARETEALKQRATPKPALSPSAALADSAQTLNIYERGEIVDYAADGVFFTGARGACKIIGALAAEPDAAAAAKVNFGYDDERGDYNIVPGDHLAYRYEIVDVLGKGSFGQVVRVVDHKEGGLCAVKIIRNKKRFHQQALVEVNILGRLREWDPDGAHATLSITSSFYFRSHLCITTPCLSINLYELIRAHNFAGFSLSLIRRFARQLLACLALLQRKRIIHCDLKPENILLADARRADVRVIDFGSSCREQEKVYTYIQSRFYRSPEVILGAAYGLPIDMWSFGCILAELYTGYPLFPGENEQEQLACIMELFGAPERTLVDRAERKKLFFDSAGKPRVCVSSKGRRRRPGSRSLAHALKCDDDAFLDFVARCLRWDPERRIRPDQALNHPFVSGLPPKVLRGGIPDEARRPVVAGSRVRSAAAVPAPAPTPVVASPAKRLRNPAVQGNAFAALARATPKSDRARLEGAPAVATGSPVKAARFSHVAAAAVAGGKSGPSAVLGAREGRALAVAGARESMGGAPAAASSAPPGAGAGAGVGRWK